MYISDEVRYTDQGNNIPISAAIFSSNLNALSVEWYHEDTLINTTNNPRFSINTDIVNRVSVLNIMNVDTDILGEYTILVYSEGRNESDSLQLVLPGTVYNLLECNYFSNSYIQLLPQKLPHRKEQVIAIQGSI